MNLLLSCVAPLLLVVYDCVLEATAVRVVICSLLSLTLCLISLLALYSLVNIGPYSFLFSLNKYIDFKYDILPLGIADVHYINVLCGLTICNAKAMLLIFLCNICGSIDLCPCVFSSHSLLWSLFEWK
jgi:hypothetical protein